MQVQFYNIQIIISTMSAWMTWNITQTNSDLRYTDTIISTDYIDFYVQKYGYIACINFNRFKKDVPSNTAIEFIIPKGYRSVGTVSQMVQIGRSKLVTYFSTKATGESVITIYDGVLGGTTVYATFFYFARL